MKNELKDQTFPTKHFLPYLGIVTSKKYTLWYYGKKKASSLENRKRKKTKQKLIISTYKTLTTFDICSTFILLKNLLAIY